jgi:hypothetical protein
MRLSHFFGSRFKKTHQRTSLARSGVLLSTLISSLFLISVQGTSASEQPSVLDSIETLVTSAPQEQQPFLSCYQMFTERLISQDNPEKENLMRAFLAAYRARALTLTGGWGYLASQTASRQGCTVYWQAFTGVMAHLAQDMSYALIQAYPTPEALLEAKATYDAIGDDLTAEIPNIQALLSRDYDPFIGEIVSFTPLHLDVLISSEQIHMARDQSFAIALQYLRGQITAEDQAHLAQQNFDNWEASVNALENVFSILPDYKNQCSGN